MPRWKARCIEHLLRVEGAEAVAVILAPRTTAPPAHTGVLWKRLAEHASMRPASAFAPVDLSGLLREVPRQTCGGGGDASARPGEDVARLRKLGLDFILDLAPGDLAPGGARDLRGVARSGVWAFRHGAPEAPDAWPAGFREILLGSPMIESALVQLTCDGHAGRVLHRGWFRTVPDSLAQSRSALLLGVAAWPARECRRLVAERERQAPGPHPAAPANGNGKRGRSEEPIGRANGNGKRPRSEEPARPLPPDRERSPSNLEVLRFALRVGRAYFDGLWTDLFRHEQWNVGVVDAPVEDVVELRKVHVRWLPAPARGSFIADPFGKAKGGGVHILAEEFDYESGKGRIASISLQEDGSVVRNPEVIPLPVHASYPYLFDLDGETYCIPETSAAREVRLFRARELPDEWEDLGAIVSDFAAADATVFRHDGRWWIFCVDVEVDPHGHLYAWWAPELRGPWQPHLLNPLKTDPRSSRPAGPPIVRPDGIYRPAQDCSETYGGAVVINRILELTPERFSEEPVCMIRPDRSGPFPDGVHTLSGLGRVTLVDGKRMVFVPGEFRRAVGARLRGLVGRG